MFFLNLQNLFEVANFKQFVETNHLGLQLLLSQCPWKEYTTDNGKVYYHNITTKESRWQIPPELEELKQKIVEEE